MKKSLLLIILALGFSSSAMSCPDCGGTCHMKDFNAEDVNSLSDAWNMAQKSIDKGLYHEALWYLDTAMKNLNAQDNVYFKYEKARVLTTLDRRAEAAAILDELISKFETMNAAPPIYTQILISRIALCDKEHMEYAKALYKKMIFSDPVLSSIEEDETGIRFKTVTEGMKKDSFLDYAADRLCISGACKSRRDIILEKDGSLRINFSGFSPKKGFWGRCEDNCDSAAVGASYACSFFKTRTCTGICVAMVETLRRTCHWCCRDENAFCCSMDLEYFQPPYCNE